jgi:outer membrane protein assembly factor BamB
MPAPGPSGRRLRRGPLIAVLALVALAAGAGLAVYLLRPRNVSHPNVEFTTPSTATKPAKRKPAQDFLWGTYGYDGARTRNFPVRSLDPPFRRGWTYRGTSLLEFPPSIRRDTLYALNDDGVAIALDTRSGRLRWKRHLGTLAASTPAVESDGRVYLTLLRGPSGSGRVVALRQRDGRMVWARDLPSRSESSPLRRAGYVYFGSEDGTVYALRARDGRTHWTFHADGAVKGGPALAAGILYFGDYSGHVYAVRASNGALVWKVGTSGARFGLGSGSFYSTAAVAFGRVFLGNTDDRVYSFAAHSGKLAWATDTGSYVYSSPATADVPGLGPTVYIGSYDGNFYAFDARSGGVRWRHASGGKISGSPTIVGDVVYFSSLGARTTAGLDVRSGRSVFSWPDGAFNPIVSDGQSLFLTGYANIYQLTPKRSAAHRARARRHVRKGR